MSASQIKVDLAARAVGITEAALLRAIGSLECRWASRSERQRQMVVSPGDVVAFATRRKLAYKVHAPAAGVELPDILINDWRDIFSRCWLCAAQGHPTPRFEEIDRRMLDLHHIQRGRSVWGERFDWPVNWFRACRRCHDGPLATMSHGKQLAIKFHFDPAGWATIEQFLSEWLRIADPEGQSPERLTAAEVEAAALEFRYLKEHI